MKNSIKKLIMAMLIMTLIACTSSEDSQLTRYIDGVKTREAKPLKPIPEFKQLKKFVYPEEVRRSPFQQKKIVNLADHLAPDIHRERQPLEELPLAQLKFVGILQEESRIWGLIKKPDGEIARVNTGDYVGQNFGKIVNIDETALRVEELVQVAGKWKKKMITFRLHESE